ncbi:C40 family peptidase [Winogradskya humida]|nr:C40 family peptidase [Actinoplanes humidus]
MAALSPGNLTTAALTAAGLAVAGRPAAQLTPASRQTAGLTLAGRPAAQLTAAQLTAAGRQAAGLTLAEQPTAGRQAAQLTVAGQPTAGRQAAQLAVAGQPNAGRQVARLTPAQRTASRRAQILQRRAAITGYARAQVGKRYRYGAAGPQSFDCSGLTRAAYLRAGIRLPHSSGSQAALAHPVPLSRAKPGDLVVGPGHVGIYLGGGMMVDAGNRRLGVTHRRMYRGLHVEQL